MKNIKPFENFDKIDERQNNSSINIDEEVDRIWDDFIDNSGLYDEWKKNRDIDGVYDYCVDNWEGQYSAKDWTKISTALLKLIGAE